MEDPRALRSRRVPADRPQPLPTHLRELRGALLGPLLLFGLLLAATFAGSDAIFEISRENGGDEARACPVTSISTI